MSLLINDLELANRLRSERGATDGAKHDEVWDGVYVMSPLPNNEHLILSSELWLVFRTLLKASGSGIAFNGVNVSDREQGWQKNYREPDVAVFLSDNSAKDCGTHWRGGPDLVVEILSPNDRAREKLDFYARLGVRELLVVDRDPWTLELYRADAGSLRIVGRSTIDHPVELASTVLPITLRLHSGPDRPLIEITTIDRRQSWMI